VSCTALAALVLAALASGPASALASTGSIAGEVKAAATQAPLEGIEVCAIATAALSEELEGGLEEEGPELGSEQLGCTKTGPHGAYMISGLAPGTFDVVFANPAAGSLNYVTQAYDAEATIKEATVVTVRAGAVSGEVNAAMVEGAELSGTVTNASTGATVEGAIVCAANVLGAPALEGACTLSGAGGTYTIIGVADGNVIVIAAAHGPLFGSYGGASSLTEATPVTVAGGQRRGGLDIALKSAAALPAGLGPTAATGTAPSTSSAGSATGKPFSSGGGSLTDAAAPGADVGLADSRVHARNNHSVVVRLTCSSDRGCGGRVLLTAKRPVRRGGRLLTETVTLGSARFETKRRSTFAVKIVLNRTGRLMVGARRRLAAHVRIVQKAPAPDLTTIKRVLILAARPSYRR